MQTLAKPSIAAVLNRLLILHQRSLPMFLSYAAPWASNREHQASAILGHMVEDQKRTAGRLADYLLERRWRVENGEFPLEITGLHDVSLQYLWPKLIEAQRSDVATIQQCIAGLQNDPFARALAEEALGAARGHLQSLEEVAVAVAAP